MRKTGIPLGILLIVVVCLVAAYPVFAYSSENFYQDEDGVFDDWGIYRTREYGGDGFFQMTSEKTFRPVITMESLGDNVDLAYDLGQEFAETYPDPNQRAEKIFYYVRDKVRYTSDIDQFDLEEFAINADELATTIKEDGIARGDCEDMSILLAVMYKGAGYRSAIVLPPGHAAVLVYLPDYKKANFLELDGEVGWVWAEATGRNNPFGWIPDEFVGENIAAYEITGEKVDVAQTPTEPGTKVAQTGINIAYLVIPFIIVVFLMGIMSIFRKGRHL